MSKSSAKSSSSIADINDIPNNLSVGWAISSVAMTSREYVDWCRNNGGKLVYEQGHDGANNSTQTFFYIYYASRDKVHVSLHDQGTTSGAVIRHIGWLEK